MTGPQDQMLALRRFWLAVVKGLVIGALLAAGAWVLLQNRSAESVPAASAAALAGPQIVGTRPAGVVMSGHYLEYGRTLVDTDRGIYMINGVHDLTKGRALDVETHADGVRMLCERGTRNCHVLLSGAF